MTTEWQDLEIGVETGRFSLFVTNEIIDEYVDSLEITHPWYTSPNSPYGGRIAPPDMLPKLGMDVLFQEYAGRVVGRNMRARQAYKFYAPIKPGMTVSAIGRLTDKYEKRGKRFVTFEALFVDEAGNPLVLDMRTQYVSQAPAAAA